MFQTPPTKDRDSIGKNASALFFESPSMMTILTILGKIDCNKLIWRQIKGLVAEKNCFIGLLAKNWSLVVTFSLK